MACFFRRRKFCRFNRRNVKEIDYKDLDTLESLFTETGKIVPSPYQGTKAQVPAVSWVLLSSAPVYLALLPFTDSHGSLISKVMTNPGYRTSMRGLRGIHHARASKPLS